MARSAAPAGFGRPIWDAIKGGNQVHGVGLVPVSFTLLAGHTTTFNRPVFITPRTNHGRFKVEAASISFGAAIGSDGTNYWTIDLQVGNDDDGWHSLGISSLSTTGGITDNTGYDLEVDGPESASPKNVFLEAGDLLRVLFTDVGAGTPATLASNTMNVVVFLRHAPPGR